MQVCLVVQRGERQFHRVAHAHFVDEAHVEHLQSHLVHQSLFAGIDTADSDLAHHLGVQGRHGAAYFDQRLRTLPAQASHGHAMDIAAGREQAGVEVGVRIEPQHTQLLASLAAMPCHGADGAYTQAVVTAQQDGQATELQLGQYRRVRGPVPGYHLVQMAIAVNGVQPGIGGAAEVAPVLHLQTVAFQRGLQPRHAQCFGAHAGAAGAGTDVGGGADEADLIVHGMAAQAQTSALNSPVWVGDCEKP